MATPPSAYVPIAPEFYYLLETLAMKRQPAQIGFVDADGIEQQRTTTITDVYAREGVEYLLMGSGETVRLDRLVKVDGHRLADY
jgi:Rho-binding antiterminator